LSEISKADAGSLSPGVFRGLFAALSALAIVPCWTVKYPVLADYPQHLARWFVLFHVHDAAYHFAGYYAPDWAPYPYVLTDVLGYALQFVLPIDLVGRCVLSLCVLSVPLGLLYFLRKAAPENEHLALFGFVIALNPIFLMGFVGSALSVGVGVFTVGLWVAYCDTPSAWRGFAVAAGIVLVYLSHLAGFGVTGIAMGAHCLVSARPIRNLLRLAALSMPGLALFVYNLRHNAAGGALLYGGRTLVWNKLRNLAFPLRLDSKPVDLAFVLMLMALLYLAYRERKQIAWQRPWVVVCAALLVVYLVAPGVYGLGGYLDVRVMPFLYLLVLAAPQIRNIPKPLILGLVLMAVLRIAVVEWIFLEHQRELTALSAAFEAIPRNAGVNPLVPLKPEGTLIGRGDVHFLAYGVIQRGFLVPTIAYLPGLQPLRVVGAGYCPNAFCEIVDPPATDWIKVAQNYDYLWVQNFPGAVPYVEKIGEPVFTNEFVTVYQTKKRPDGTAGTAGGGH
jgi:hypothetical protein